MAKNRHKKRKVHKKSALFSKKLVALILLAPIIAIIIVYAVAYFKYIPAKKDNKKETEVLMSKMKKMLLNERKRLNRLIEQKKEKKISPITIKQKKIEKETSLSEIEDYKSSIKEHKIKIKEYTQTNKQAIYSGKPRLSIIIDDVAFAHQIKLIKKIPFRVTPSFFPPTNRHPNTVEFSKDFDFAMVHLPAEALSFGRAEPKTLKVEDSINEIRTIIKNIKKWFPSIKYYNNHTGSKFTANYKAMDRLIRVMRDEDIHFVDSRTTAQTKAPEIAKKYGLKLYSRNVFIDNDIEKRLIIKQLKKAVSVAKKRGYAVAIGHPHENTLRVLINAKDILKDVELVYLKDL